MPAALILLVLNLDNSSETVRSLRAPLHAAGWNPAMHHSTRCPKHAGLSAAHCSTRHNYTGVVGQLIKARGAVGPVAVAAAAVALAAAPVALAAVAVPVAATAVALAAAGARQVLRTHVHGMQRCDQSARVPQGLDQGWCH